MRKIIQESYHDKSNIICLFLEKKILITQRRKKRRWSSLHYDPLELWRTLLVSQFLAQLSDDDSWGEDGGGRLFIILVFHIIWLKIDLS